VFWFLRTFLAAVILVMSGSAALAEPADQAATATPAPAQPSNCVVPPQGVVIVVENPQPGASIFPGQSLVMNGIAYDVASTSGPGISSVTAYLGSRDAGGIFLGNGVLGQPNPAVGSDSPLATAGWTLRTSTLPTGSGARSVFVYARSSVSNKEASLEIPVFLGPQPTAVRGQVPTPVLPPPPACTPTPTAAPTATATPPPAAQPAVTAPTAAPTTAAAAPTIAVPTLAPLPTTEPLATATLRPTATPITSGAQPAAVAPATATTAPRGGGIPAELGLPLLALGALVFGGGYALRRRK
jgi:hypothetical protein